MSSTHHKLSCLSIAWALLAAVTMLFVGCSVSACDTQSQQGYTLALSNVWKASQVLRICEGRCLKLNPMLVVTVLLLPTLVLSHVASRTCSHVQCYRNEQQSDTPTELQRQWRYKQAGIVRTAEYMQHNQTFKLTS